MDSGDYTSNESIYIYKFYKKGKLSVEKIDGHMRRLCLAIINSEENITMEGVKNNSASATEDLMSVADQVVTFIVHYKLFIKSLQFVQSNLKVTQSNDTDDVMKVISYIEKNSKFLENNTNVNSNLVFERSLGSTNKYLTKDLQGYIFSINNLNDFNFLKNPKK
jgi:hypothetical protein